MKEELWKEHMISWKEFLNRRIDSTDDDGDRIKYERQLKTIERVSCGAVLNPGLLLEFISPQKKGSVTSFCTDYFLNLNKSQKKAVQLSLGGADLSLIQGPPGTGKTQVIAEICLQLMKAYPFIRILICSETHVAVNNVLSRIAEMEQGIRIVRIRDKENDDNVDEFSPERIINSYFKWARGVKINDSAYEIIESELKESINVDSRRRSQIEKALALSANIVGMTCNRVAAYDFKDRTEMFDYAIVDEVCKATLPEILSPLIVSRKAVLLGDPKQLPPIFCSEEQEIIRDINNCNLDRFMYIDALFDESKRASVLDTQYRMTNEIGSLISDLFYNGSLKNGKRRSVTNSVNWITYNPSRAWPEIMNESSGNLEIYNDDECKIIVDLLKQIVSEKNLEHTVAVISPYRAQISHLRKECNSMEGVRIDTVDKFQGKESDIVIFSVTRTTGSFRFLADKRRLNVALSRAKEKVIIVGDIEYAEKEVLLKQILDRCNIVEYKDGYPIRI